MNTFHTTCLAATLAVAALDAMAQVPDPLPVQKPATDAPREPGPQPAVPDKPHQRPDTMPGESPPREPLTPLPNGRRDPEGTLTHPPLDSTGGEPPRPTSGSDRPAADGREEGR